MWRRVLVTGGAGFIGSHSVEAFLEAGIEVACLDDLSTGRRERLPAGVPCFVRDIRGDMTDAFREFRPDGVLHLAAQVSVARSMADPAHDASINILGSLGVMTQCLAHGVRRIVFASSAAVYGSSVAPPYREDQRLQPVSSYGASKTAVEHYLRAAGASRGLQWIALRYANVYGPRQDAEGEAGVVAIFCRQLLRGERPTIFGSGDLTRDYVWVGDVARANVAAFTALENPGEDPVYNVGTGRGTTTQAVFRELRDRLAPGIEARMGPSRAGDVMHSRLANDKLRAATGWEPRVGIEEGLDRTAAWMREATGDRS